MKSGGGVRMGSSFQENVTGYEKNVHMNKSVWLTEKPKVFGDILIIGWEQRNRRKTQPTGIRE